MKCSVPTAEIGIYKSRKNELFHFAMDGDLDKLSDDVNAYLFASYWMNYRARFVSGQMLERGDLAGIKLLILPSALYMTDQEAKQLDAFVKAGGVVLSEAHLASYNGTTGRYSRRTPGGGLADAWNIRETFSTSTFHLKVDQAGAMLSNLADDERKSCSTIPARESGGEICAGAIEQRTDRLGRESIRDSRCARQRITRDVRRAQSGRLSPEADRQRARVFCCATNLGQGSKRDAAGLRKVLSIAADRAGLFADVECRE